MSAVADPTDAVAATAPPFKFDFVAFLNNFSAKFYIFVSVVPSPFASDSISALWTKNQVSRRYGLKNWKIRGKNKLDPSKKKLQKQQSSRNMVVNLETHL